MTTSPRRWLPPLLTLLAGILLGVIGMAFWIHTRLHALHDAGPEGVALHVLDEELDLDEQQEQRVREVLHGIWTDLAAFHVAHEAELHAILSRGSGELGSILRADQDVDWRDMHRRLVNQVLISGLLGSHDGGDDAPSATEPVHR